MRLKTDKQWREWEKRVRKGQLANLRRAQEKLPQSKRIPIKLTRKRAKGSRSQKEAGPTGPSNLHGFACPECWARTETLRNDGKSVPRHKPIREDAELYRDTEYCNGQGKIARAVKDKEWEPGNEPEESITATKWLKENE